MSDQHEKADRLRALHVAPEILVLVNVWDVASARAVASARGCQALATASHSVAAAHGYDDGERIPVELMLAVVARIAAGVSLPVTADLESGYGDVPGTVRSAIRAGAVGGNIEDGMRPLPAAVRAVRDAVTAGAETGFVLNARTDAFLAAAPGRAGADQALREALARGRAYLDAGADCVFVPGCTDTAHIRRLVGELGPGRVSLLGVPGLPSPGELQTLGVARVSYGPFPQQWALQALTDRAAQLVAPPAQVPATGEGEDP